MALGLSRRTVVRYANGQSTVPKVVELLCAKVEEDHMTYSKTIPMHKRMAAGEPISGMKKGGKADCYKDGGAVKAAVHKRNSRKVVSSKGGKVCD